MSNSALEHMRDLCRKIAQPWPGAEFDPSDPVCVVRKNIAEAIAAIPIEGGINQFDEMKAALEQISKLRPGIWREAGITGDETHAAPGIANRALKALAKARPGDNPTACGVSALSDPSLNKSFSQREGE